MPSHSSSRARKIERLRNKEFREAYVRAMIEHGLAHQIRTLRTSRGWSQEQLAEKVGAKSQSVISRLEDPSYGRHTLQTLEKLGDAFDVALLVKFVSFNRLLTETEDLTPGALDVVGFNDECDAIIEEETEASYLADDLLRGITFNSKSPSEYIKLPRERDMDVSMNGSDQYRNFYVTE